MKIRLETVLDADLGRVQFDSPVGRAQGYWKGREAPAPGDCTVELDFPDDIDISTIPKEADDSANPSIASSSVGRQVLVTGTVDAVGDDDVVSLRLGPDVILLEIPPGEPVPAPGQSISFTTPRIDLYPYEL